MAAVSHVAAQVGFLETRQQAERRSGAEAWSLRVHERLTELPFAEVAGRFASGDDEEPPFHRIVYFKHKGLTVWCVRVHRHRRVHAAAVATAMHAAAAGRRAAL